MNFFIVLLEFIYSHNQNLSRISLQTKFNRWRTSRSFRIIIVSFCKTIIFTHNYKMVFQWQGAIERASWTNYILSFLFTIKRNFNCYTNIHINPCLLLISQPQMLPHRYPIRFAEQTHVILVINCLHTTTKWIPQKEKN